MRFLTGYADAEAQREDLPVRFVSVLPDLTPTTGLGSRVLTAPGVLRMVPVGADGQPAPAAYRDDGHVYAHALHVLEVGDDAVSAITVFLGADLFGPFGLPTALP